MLTRFCYVFAGYELATFVFEAPAGRSSTFYSLVLVHDIDHPRGPYSQVHPLCRDRLQTLIKRLHVFLGRFPDSNEALGRWMWLGFDIARDLC